MAAGPTYDKFPYRTNLVNDVTLTRYPALQGGEVHSGYIPPPTYTQDFKEKFLIPQSLPCGYSF
jgi:hypothetical protein